MDIYTGFTGRTVSLSIDANNSGDCPFEKHICYFSTPTLRRSSRIAKHVQKGSFLIASID